MNKLNKIALIAVISLFFATVILVPESKIDAVCNHHWVVESNLCTSPTCTQNGRTWYECVLCYDYKIVEIPATGIHDWSEWKVWDEPDCSNDGKEYRTCKECYEKEERDIPTKSKYHTWSKWYVYYSDKSTRRECYTCKKKQIVKLKHTGKRLSVKEKFYLKVAKKPHGDRAWKYTSSNKKVAKVDSYTGRVTALKKGKATITAHMESGCKARCTVTVK